MMLRLRGEGVRAMMLILDELQTFLVILSACVLHVALVHDVGANDALWVQAEEFERG